MSSSTKAKAMALSMRSMFETKWREYVWDVETGRSFIAATCAAASSTLPRNPRLKSRREEYSINAIYPQSKRMLEYGSE